MDKLIKKTFTTSRTYTYTYYHHAPPIATTKPTILLCHGWPDSAELFTGILPSLLDMGHPILIPDLLGCAGTSKPADYKEYSLKGMANDLFELLDAHNADRIIPLGHDWGSALAQRVYLYRPEQCVGLILLDVAYMVPSTVPFDLDAINKATEQAFGYPFVAYWDLFAADDGPDLMLQHVETLFHLLHWDHPDAMKTFFATYGNTRKLLTTTSASDYPLKAYARAPGFKESWISRMQCDGFEGPQAWYKAHARNVNFEDEKGWSEEGKKIKVPCLYVSGTEDSVCRTDQMEAPGVRELVAGELTVKIVESNHWITFEKPEEVGGIIGEWLGKRF